MPVFIVADSRGTGLQRRFNKRVPGVIKVITYPGCNIKKLFIRANRKLNHRCYNTVIIMGGICSITHKDQESGSIILASTDADLYREKVSKSIKFGLNLL